MPRTKQISNHLIHIGALVTVIFILGVIAVLAVRSTSQPTDNRSQASGTTVCMDEQTILPSVCGERCGQDADCDSGLSCVKASSAPTGLCRNPACTTTLNCQCPTPVSASSHVIKLVKTATPGYFDVDAFILDGVTVEEGNTLFTYAGKWGTSMVKTLSGGTETYTNLTGSSVSFTTSASSVQLISAQAKGRGSFDVYVDGVKKTTTPINTLGTSTVPQYKIDLSGYLQ